ncbi:hypothetical protein T4C_2991 [Trichinella pseudospiralis]|uniref:Uncharacterized protein n=1 Tax=Trichinella pseudospiralis TaxID=6337 RepID=A0A0V1JJQ8_TRIPS|nr:hypothetical protein T4C_2991 [Trichinella pseudospiralis]
MCVLFLRQLAKQVEHLISVAADEHADIIILIRRSISVSQGLSTIVIILIKPAFGWPRIQACRPVLKCKLSAPSRVSTRQTDVDDEKDDEDADDTHHLLDNT